MRHTQSSVVDVYYLRCIAMATVFNCVRGEECRSGLRVGKIEFKAADINVKGTLIMYTYSVINDIE